MASARSGMLGVAVVALLASCQKPVPTVNAGLSCYLPGSVPMGEGRVPKLTEVITCRIDLAPGQSKLSLAATLQTSFPVKKGGTVENILVPEHRGSVFTSDAEPGSGGSKVGTWSAFVAELWPAHAPYDPALRGDFLPCTDFDVYANLFDKGKLVWHAVKRVEQDCKRR